MPDQITLEDIGRKSVELYHAIASYGYDTDEYNYPLANIQEHIYHPNLDDVQEV